MLTKIAKKLFGVLKVKLNPVLRVAPLRAKPCTVRVLKSVKL